MRKEEEYRLDFAQNPVRTIGLLDPFGQPLGAQRNNGKCIDSFE